MSGAWTTPVDAAAACKARISSAISKRSCPPTEYSITRCGMSLLCNLSCGHSSCDFTESAASLSSWHGEVLESVFRGARRTLRVRTGAGELRIEVPALAHPEVGETIEIGAAKFALWAFAGP